MLLSLYLCATHNVWRVLIVYRCCPVVKVMSNNIHVRVEASILCVFVFLSCSDRISNQNRMEFVNNESCMVFIVWFFFRREEKCLKERKQKQICILFL